MALKEVKKAPAAKAKPAVKKPVAAAKPAAKPAVKPAAAKKAVAPKGKIADVEFKVFAPDSSSVAVAGDFSNWKPVALKKDKTGNWSGKIKLSSGVYQYKIVFNGQYWETDSSNPERVPDSHGGENSIKRV